MNTRNNKRWVVVLGLLAIASLGVVLRLRPGARHDAQPPIAADATAKRSATPKPVASAAPAPSQVIAPHACRFSAGQALAYGISISGSSTLPPALLGQDPHAAPITLPNSTSLVLDLKALADTASGSTVLLAHYRDVHSTLLDDVKTLSSPFLLRVAESCEITGFAREASTAKAYARTQQSIAHELMWTWPASDGAERAGEDGYGPYVASYTLQPGTTPGVKRELLSYDKFWEEEQGGPQRLELVPSTSVLTVSVDDGPWFSSLRGHSRLAGKTTAFDTHIVAWRADADPHALDGLSEQVSAYRWEDLLPQMFKLRTPRPVTGADVQARAAVVRYQPRETVDRFMTRFNDKAPFQQLWPELTTYLEARPDQTKAVVDELKKGTVTQDAAPAFYVALGRARTPQSLAALHEIFQSEASPLPERVRAAFAMIDRDDVGIELAHEFASYARHIDDRSSRVKRVLGREVALALGALSGLHEEDTDMRTVVMDTARSILKTSKDPVMVRPAYSALANMGDVSALPIAQQAFASGSPELRAVAAIVVRRMSPRDTSDIVAGWLARETDWNVKRAIYSTVSRQMADIPLPASPALVARAVQDLQTQPGNITRKAIIRILGHSAAKSPEARAALMAQVSFELKKKDSSQYSVIARYLTPEDTREALRNAL